VLVDHQVLGAGSQDLQGLEELDDRGPIVAGQGSERLPGCLGFSGVGQDCLSKTPIPGMGAFARVVDPEGNVIGLFEGG
jgi:hypothetical protein